MHIRKVPTPEEFNRIVESIWKEQSTPAQRRNVHPNLAMNYIRARYREVFKKSFRTGFTSVQATDARGPSTERSPLTLTKGGTTSTTT